MANATQSYEKTSRVTADLRLALDEFLEDPLSEAREADVKARMAEFRDAVRAGVLAPLRSIHRQRRSGG